MKLNGKNAALFDHEGEALLAKVCTCLPKQTMFNCPKHGIAKDSAV